MGVIKGLDDSSEDLEFRRSRALNHFSVHFPKLETVGSGLGLNE